jgi:hypothetical protein
VSTCATPKWACPTQVACSAAHYPGNSKCLRIRSKRPAILKKRPGRRIGNTSKNVDRRCAGKIRPFRQSRKIARRRISLKYGGKLPKNQVDSIRCEVIPFIRSSLVGDIIPSVRSNSNIFPSKPIGYSKSASVWPDTDSFAAVGGSRQKTPAQHLCFSYFVAAFPP